MRQSVETLVAFHGDLQALAAASGISAITWGRWAAGTQSPRPASRIRASVMFAAAGLASPWVTPQHQEAVVRPLFDLATLQPVAPVAFQPEVWAGLTGPVVEDLAQASCCNYSVEEDHGSTLILRDTSIQGGSLTTWRTVACPTLSYALRLPDGRLVEFAVGSAISLHEDTAARKIARGRQSYWRVS